jgi:hypothetical protein
MRLADGSKYFPGKEPKSDRRRDQGDASATHSTPYAGIIRTVKDAASYTHEETIP